MQKCASRADAIAIVIEYMLKSAISVKEPDVRVCEVNSTASWCLDCGWFPNCVISEVGVHGDSIAMEISDRISNFEANIAGVSKVLLSDIVWKFALVKVDFAMVSIPLN